MTMTKVQIDALLASVGAKRVDEVTAGRVVAMDGGRKVWGIRCGGREQIVESEDVYLELVRLGATELPTFYPRPD